MTYDSHETSVESGQPVEVFEVLAGATTYFYTSSQTGVTIGAQAYTFVSGLDRNETVEGPDVRSHDFQVTLPTTDAVAQLFVGVLPGFRVRLTVKRYHRNDLPTPEVVQIFDGFIQSASFAGGDGKVTTLTARSVLASIRRQFPRRTFQSACNHILYDTGTCKVDDTDPAYRASALSVASMVGNVLTVSSGLSGTYTDGWMNAGFVEVVGGSDFRLITDHVGNILTLLQPFATQPSSVNVFAGCGHVVSICKTKFDNVVNYGGFAFVPTDNVFDKGL